MTKDIKDDGRLEKPPRVFVEHPWLSPEDASTGIMSLVPKIILTTDLAEEPNNWQASGPKAKSDQAVPYRDLARSIYSEIRSRNPQLSKTKTRILTRQTLEKRKNRGEDVRVYAADYIGKLVDD
jgi:hypothetical protein